MEATALSTTMTLSDILLQLLPGLGQTLLLTLVSLALSLPGGLLYVLLSQSRFNLFARAWLELFRTIPLLVWLFLLFFGLPLWMGVDIGGVGSAILVFVLWGSSEAGEVFRGAWRALPAAQLEAAISLGLNAQQRWRFVILPLLLRLSLPPLMNVATRLIKTSSLTMLIGVTELTKAGQQIIEREDNALLIYGLLLLGYFAICFPLSLAARRLEQRWSLA